MTIAVGDTLPTHSFPTPGVDGPEKITTSELFDDKTAVLFGVPGAFTPTCHANHLPGYVELADELKQAGVDEIAVVSVNDIFVMQAWQEASNTGNKVKFLADGSAQFTKAIGLELDLVEAGLGPRVKRFSMLIKNGKVEALNIEPNPGQADETGAQKMLELLQG